MTPPLKGVTPVDFAVIAAYMALMLGIGFYAMRFNRGASDYFKGGSRIHWLAAGLSSFMSGFSAWTFTGAAGLAYQHGLVAILLYVGNACTFLLGYFLFAQRWRRASPFAREARRLVSSPSMAVRRAVTTGTETIRVAPSAERRASMPDHWSGWTSRRNAVGAFAGRSAAS